MEATIATLAGTDMNGSAVTPNTPLELLRVTRNHDGGRTRDNDDDAIINQTDITWKLADRRHQAHAAGRPRARAREAAPLELHARREPEPGRHAGADLARRSLLNPDPVHGAHRTRRRRTCARAPQGDTVAIYVQDQMEFTRAVEGAARPALGALQGRGAHRELRSPASSRRAPSSAPTRCGADARGLIFQPTATQSYYVSAGNSYNPSGELGVYGGTGTNLNPINEDLDPEENRGYEVGATWDFADGMQLRAAIFRNEKVERAHGSTTTGTTVLAGKRRVDGIELQLAGLHPAQLGGLQRRRLHGRQDRHGPGEHAGQDAAGRGRRRRQRLDGVQARRRLGGRRRRARHLGLLAHRRQHGRGARATRSCDLTAAYVQAELRDPRSTCRTSPTRPTTSAATRTTPTA